MKRLTKRSNKTVHENGVCCTHYLSKECEERSGFCTDECPWEEAAWSKLADYEDLEEQCIAENQCDLRMLLLKWKEFFDDIVALYDYRKAEEQGLLRKLPVAVGTKVYYPLRPRGFTTFTIVKIKIYEDEIIFEDDCGNEWEERHFGKVLFLTSEEAESALAEKGGVE